MADYYYTDANRQPAGPVSFEELKDMFELGRLSDGALVAEVGASEWQPVASLFGQPVTGDAGYSAPPVSPTGGIGSPHENFEPLAGWAFGFGISAWVCLGFLGAVPGVILGHMALGKMKRENNTNQTAKVLAMIGLIASYVSLVFSVLAVGFFILVLAASSVNP